jgi:hypothetical protein
MIGDPRECCRSRRTGRAQPGRKLPLRFYDLAYPWTAALLVTPHYLFVHAGYDLAQPPDEQQEGMLLWGSVYRHSQSRTSRIVVRGHEPCPTVNVTAEGWIGVDTGCGLGGHLSCLRLSDGQVYTARD